MSRQSARAFDLVALGTAAVVAAGLCGPLLLAEGPPRRRPLTEAITDKDVEAFGLQVYWKALCVLGEHARPLGAFPLGDDVFVTDTHTHLTCFSAKDGSRRWISVLDQPQQPIFAPAADARDVFVVAGGHLVAVDRRYGRERWRVRLKSVPSSGPAIFGDFVYVAGADGWLRAFSRRTQREEWFFNARSPLHIRPIPVGVAAQQNIFIVAANRQMYCMSAAERAIIWQQEAPGPVIAEPAVVGRNLYVPCMDFNLYAIDGTTGKMRWIFRSGSQIIEAPVAVGATVYFPSFENGFWAVRREDGKRRWWRETGQRLLAVSRDYVYIADHQKAILICDKATGELKARYVPPPGYDFMPTNTETDALYLLSHDGLLVCLREIEAIRSEAAPPVSP